MRVAVFTNTYTPHVGGVAHSVSALADWMRGRGHECLVFAPEYPGQPANEEGVVRLPAIENINGSGFSLRLPSFGVIGRRIEAFQPDLIHSHHPYVMGDAAIRSAGYRHLPLVFTHHTRYEDYVHYLFKESKPLMRVASELATEYANLCDQVVVPSESIRDLITGRGVRVPVEVIPTGVDVDRFSKGAGAGFRQRHGLPADGRVIGHVGRLEAEKNLVFLADAACRFLAADPSAVFLVVGQGAQLKGMRSQAVSAGVAERVVFTGRLTGQELVDAYHAMDLFIFSSKSETQGMVLAEAMAAGKPVIALDAPGAREVVRDGRNGRLLAESATAQDFAGAIAGWLAEGGATRDRWREEIARTAGIFSLDACMGRMESLYRRLVERHPANGKISVLDQLMSRFETELDLAAEKARAASAALSPE